MMKIISRYRGLDEDEGDDDGGVRKGG